ncbi:MAG: hypothetical protein ABI333_26810 [bacterium]
MRRWFFACLPLLIAVCAAACSDDDDTPPAPPLTVTPDPVGVETGAYRTVKVTLDERFGEDHVIPVRVEDTGVASVPAEVTVAASALEATFRLDGLAEGTTTLHVGEAEVGVHVVSTAFQCGDPVAGTLTDTDGLGAQDAGDLTGAAVAPPGDHHDWPLTQRSVTLCCAADITPTGFRAVGPAVQVDIDGGLLEKFVEVTLPYKDALLPDGAHAGQLRVAVQLRGYPSWTAPVPNVWVEPHAVDGRLRFRYDEGATFQVVVPADAGQPKQRHFTYRAILGFSMGGGGAGSVGLRNPDRFDFIAQAGGEPGIDMVYSVQSILDYLLGGFCNAADEAAGTGNIGELCPLKRPPLTRQYERPSSYEHWIYEPYEGTYIYLRREFYIRAMRDLVRAFGNPFYYNPLSTVLPPGVPESYLSVETPCASPIVLQNFYNRDYNPDGSHDVITYCDASESEDSPDLGIAVFDPALPKTNPLYVALAVDVNGNGVRDSGEPVLQMLREPFSDVGVDGLPSAEEPGYDPITNPDPSNDDYHWLKNPWGTEGNWRYDDGEPFEDTGLDGVAGAGCEIDSGTPGCYDHGEGNGVYDVTPGYESWLSHGARSLYARLTPEQQARVTVWSDSGIRDFFNCHVSTNQFVGQQASMGEQVRVYMGFQRMTNNPVTETTFDFQRVDYDTIGRHIYVQYGNPDANQAQIDLGDGRHVGAALEFIYRLTTPFAFISQRWPDGDRALENDDRPREEHFLGTGNDPLTFTASNGRETHYSVYLPPGYFLDANAGLRYPVVYVLHGYGMDPDDIIEASGVFENYMIGPNIVDSARYQKMIIVYVDGRCRPGGQLGTDGNSYMIWSDLGADGCEKGTFYADSPTGSTALGATQLLELMDIIDQDYRTKAPESLDVND